jgi:hypothetical protein
MVCREIRRVAIPLRSGVLRFPTHSLTLRNTMNFRYRCFAAFALLGCVLATAGCGGGTHKVEGVVLMGDSPLEGATVMFFPTTEGAQAGSGKTDAAGKFVIMNPSSKDGTLPSGTYKVTVTKIDLSSTAEPVDVTALDPTTAMAKVAGPMKKSIPGAKIISPPGMSAKSGKNLIPHSYSKTDTTPITITVPASGPVTIKIDK